MKGTVKRYLSRKVVSVSSVTGHSDADVVAFAYDLAKERQGVSSFGHALDRLTDATSATVTIFID